MIKSYLQLKESINGLSDREANDVLLKQVCIDLLILRGTHQTSHLSEHTNNGITED